MSVPLTDTLTENFAGCHGRERSIQSSGTSSMEVKDESWLILQR